jgi:hypothetical protein
VEAKRYRVVVKGRLSERLGSAFSDLTLDRSPGQTVLSGATGQEHLASVLARLDDLGIQPVRVEDDG